jgi:hypothetical protein
LKGQTEDGAATLNEAISEISGGDSRGPAARK